MIWMDVDIALSEVPVNLVPLVSDTDFKTVDEGIAYNESGMALYWHFTTTGGATSVTAVTPTTGGAYDWAHQDHGMYTIEIPATGGASINNDTEGFGYFTGQCDGVLPWRGPTIGFRAAALNNALIDGGDYLEADIKQILGTTLTETSTGYLAAAFKKLFDVATPLLVASDVMRGTDDAALADKLLAYFQLLIRSDDAIMTDRATELGEINANEGSGAGNYDPQDHGIEVWADTNVVFQQATSGTLTSVKQTTDKLDSLLEVVP